MYAYVWYICHKYVYDTYNYIIRICMLYSMYIYIILYCIILVTSKTGSTHHWFLHLRRANPVVAGLQRRYWNWSFYRSWIRKETVWKLVKAAPESIPYLIVKDLCSVWEFCSKQPDICRSSIWQLLTIAKRWQSAHSWLIGFHSWLPTGIQSHPLRKCLKQRNSFRHRPSRKQKHLLPRSKPFPL